MCKNLACPGCAAPLVVEIGADAVALWWTHVPDCEVGRDPARIEAHFRDVVSAPLALNPQGQG